MNTWPWNLNNITVYPLVISEKGVVTRNLLKYLENTSLSKNILIVGQNAAPLQTCHIERIGPRHAP